MRMTIWLSHARPATARLRRAALPALAAAVLASLTTGVAPAMADTAATNASNRTLETFLSFKTRSVTNVGPAKSSIGDTTFATGSVRLDAAGTEVGTFTTRAVVVVPDTGSGRELRDTQVTVRLPEGMLLTEAFTSEPTATPPDTPNTLVILGGTGPYSGARGTAVIRPVSPGEYSFTFELLPAVAVDPDKVSIIRLTQTSAEAGSVTVPDADQGTSMSYAALGGTASGQGSARPWNGYRQAISVSIPGGPVTSQWTATYSLRGGTLLIGSMQRGNGGVREPSVITHEVLGGTGLYAGARGTVTIDNAADPASLTVRLLGSADTAGGLSRLRYEATDVARKPVVSLDGDLVYVGSVSNTYSTVGSQDPAGTGILMTTCYAPDEAGVTVLYESSRRRIDLAGGSLLGVSTFSRPISIASDLATEWMVVTGGTGDYAGAVGTVAIDRGDPADGAQFVRIRLLN